MAKLYFKVGSDWEEVVRLRNEIAKLKQELKSMDGTQSPVAFKTLNTQLAASTHRMDELVTNAAKAGAVMEGDFKKKIFNASQSVNSLTEKIITQKSTIKGIEADVKRLGEAYRTALKRNPFSANGKLNEYNAARKALDEEKASLFGLTQQQANARLSVKKLRDEYALYKNDGKQVVETNNGIAISWKKTLGIIGGAATLKALGSEIIRVRGEFQSMQTAMETMVGKDVAGPLMAQVKELAKISPLTMTDMVGAEKMMLGFNIQAEDTIKYLKALSDISMGESGKFNSLTLAFSQMSATGKLLGGDLNQMINAGFNPLQQISEKTGKSIATLKDEMSKGAISAEMVQQAFLDAASAGGKFYNMSENASKTINGQLSMMQDALDDVFNELGTRGEGVIMSGIQATTSLIQNYETVGKVLAGMVATYGVYRTAVMLVTAAESKHTLVEIGLTNVRIMARKAQLALNASMLTNPYVALVVAVGGLVTAMWAMSDSATVATRAQKEYNEIKDIASKKEQEHKQKIDELISSARDESLATLTRQKSLEALREEYPKIFELYDLEKLKLDDILKIKRQINEEDSTRAAKEKREDYTSLKQTVANQQRFLQLKDNPDQRKNMSDEDLSIWKMFAGKQSYVQVREDMQKNAEMLKLLQKDIVADNIASYKVELKSYSKEKLEAELKMAQSEASKRNGFNVGGFMIKGGDLENVVSSINATLSEKKSPTTYQEDLAKAKEDWLSAKKGYEALLKDQKATSAEVKKAKDDLTAKEKTYKDLGGVTGNALNKQENQAEKLRQQKEKLKLLTDKQTREQARAEADEANNIEQLKIDRLKDGGEKTLKQRALNHKKELEAIEREAEDKKQKVIDEARTAFEANPDNKKKSFNAEDFIKSEPAKKKFAVIDNVAKENKITSETKYNRGDDLTGLLSEYQDYTDKRLAIEKKFNDDLAVLDEQRKVAVEKGDIKQVEQIDRVKAQATANKGKELMGLDYEKMKESPEYVRAFENLKETSSETLNSLLSQFENAKQTAAKVLSPDQLREYTTTIQNIMDELDSRNPFQALTDKKQELSEAELELSNAQDALEKARADAEAVKNGAKIQTGARITGFDKNTGQVTSEKVYLSEAQALAKVKEKIDNYNAAKDKTTKANAKVKKAEKDVKAQIDELSKSISEVGDAIGGTSGEIISLIGSIGTFTMAAISGVQAAADTSANAISTVEKASVILAIISAAVQIAMKIFDLFGKDTTTEDYEKAKEAYESYINILDEVIDKQLELAETLAGDNANAAYEKAIELIKQQTEAAKVLGKQYLNSGASGKSHSKGYNEVDDMSAEGWADAAKALGMSVEQFKKVMGGRMTGLFDLTDEQLVQLQENAYIFWAQLDSDTQDYANQIAEGVAQVKDVLEQQMQDVTLIDVDTLRSDFQDLLTDMDSDTADFADNFEEYMRNAILNSMLKESYMDRLKKWREKFYNAMDDGMTQKEYEDLKAEGQQLSGEMKAERDKLKDMFGWTDSYSQSSSKGGYQTMDQDTGEELNGRFAALQMAGEEIKVQNTQQSQSLNILTIKTDAILSVNTETRNIADEIRTIQVNSYLELQEIRQNTGDTVKQLKLMDEKLKSIENNTKNM